MIEQKDFKHIKFNGFHLVNYHQLNTTFKAVKTEHFSTINMALTSFICSLCGYSFESKLSKANKKFHEIKIHNTFGCEQCNAHFKDTVSLYDHLVTIHSRQKCETCKKSFKTKDSLRKHVALHSTLPKNTKNRKKEKFSCDVCSREFVGLRALKVHVFNTHLVNEIVSKVGEEKNEDLVLIAEILAKVDRSVEGKNLIANMKMSFSAFQRLNSEMKRFDI